MLILEFCVLVRAVIGVQLPEHNLDVPPNLVNSTQKISHFSDAIYNSDQLTAMIYNWWLEQAEHILNEHHDESVIIIE